MRGVGLSAPKLRGADAEKSDDEIARSSFDLRSAQEFCFDYFDQMDNSGEPRLATPVLRSSADWPNIRISAPATGARSARFSRRNCPTALADAPNEINTKEKPAMKAKDVANSPARGGSSWRNCSMPMPESMET
jgi:hypothetical protein